MLWVARVEFESSVIGQLAGCGQSELLAALKGEISKPAFSTNAVQTHNSPDLSPTFRSLTVGLLVLMAFLPDFLSSHDCLRSIRIVLPRCPSPAADGGGMDTDALEWEFLQNFQSPEEFFKLQTSKVHAGIATLP